MKNAISLKVILDRLLRNPLFSDLTFEAAIDYTVDVIGLIGSPFLYEDKVSTLTILEHRALIPCDLVDLKQVRLVLDAPAQPMKISNDVSGGTDVEYSSNLEWYNNIDPRSFKIVRNASNTFHREYSYRDDSKNLEGDLTYSLNNGVIYTNFKEGCIQVAYRGIATDEENFPKIPDNPSVKLCIEHYIKFKYYGVLWELGKISDKVYQKAEQEYSFYIGQATNRLNMPDMDKMEALGNTIKGLLPRKNAYSKFFNDSTLPEQIRKY